MSPLACCPSAKILVLLTSVALGLAGARAEDAPAVDAGQMLKSLRQLREQAAVQTKASKQKVIQEVNAASASGESAVVAWEKAVMATQFDGVTREATAFKAWRNGEGEALKEAEAKNAARLHFLWLGLTLQRSSGIPVKDLLPALVNYTRELANDQVAMDNLNEAIKRENERGDGRHGNQRKSNDADVKKMHDDILQKPLGSSVVVQWLKLTEWVNVEKWEDTPGNLDGIFEKTVLPELRAQRDPRVLEYWDARIKREGESAARSKLEFEHEKFNTRRLPLLLWKRAGELAAIGSVNRAATEMYAIIHKYPGHPNAAEWMTKLEELLLPPASAATAPAAPAAPAPGTLPPPAR